MDITEAKTWFLPNHVKLKHSDGRIAKSSERPEVLAEFFREKQWGNNLKKFEGVQLPGGITLNGQNIYQEALDELTKIEEEMNLAWELPPDGLIG